MQTSCVACLSIVVYKLCTPVQAVFPWCRVGVQYWWRSYRDIRRQAMKALTIMRSLARRNIEEPGSMVWLTGVERFPALEKKLPVFMIQGSMHGGIHWRRRLSSAPWPCSGTWQIQRQWSPLTPLRWSLKVRQRNGHINTHRNKTAPRFKRGQGTVVKVLTSCWVLMSLTIRIRNASLPQSPSPVPTPVPLGSISQCVGVLRQNG